LLINLGASILSSADFSDMVFLPNHLNLQTQKYDIVFIDECQDLNACQRELMKKAIKPDTGRFIAVGDPAQAIYGFAGADSDSFQKLIDIPNTITLPLSVCYRCGSDIIDYAKKLMPQIEASPNAKKGLIDNNFSYKNIVKGDMVICRNTMPLVALCMKYLSKGIKAYVMGTDISASLITMIESCRRKTEEFSCENIFARIYKEKNKLVKNIMNKEKCTEQEANENSLVISFSDKISTLETLSNGCLTGDDLIAKLKVIFSDDADGICLSTIHKSKGLEADRVFIIHSELMPSKHAKKDWEQAQEKNLMYVAYTRAKSVLGFVTDFDAYSDHESKENDIVIKEGGFVGIVGEKHRAKLTIVMMKEMNTSFGDTTLFEMVDEHGNLFSKFGDIPERFLISNHAEVEVGSIVEFNATIKAHKEFKGTKTNVISTISR
jgi:superfamily I DNA/RNA helicase